MKKTLFLSAILGAALCSSAFAETLNVETDASYTADELNAYDSVNVAAGVTLSSSLSGLINPTVTLQENAKINNSNAGAWGDYQGVKTLTLVADAAIQSTGGFDVADTLTLNGHTLTLSTDRGSGGIYIKGDIDSGKLLLTKGASQINKVHTTDNGAVDLQVNTGATLRLAQNFDANSLSGSGSLMSSDRSTTLTLNSAEAQTFSGSINSDGNRTDRTFTLKNNGTGILTFSGSVGGNTTLEGILNGTSSNVKFTGKYNAGAGTLKNVEIVNLDATGGSNASITLDGVVGSFAQGSVQRNLTLAGNGVTQSGGVANTTLTFQKLDGSGKYEKTFSDTMTYIIQDATTWTGSFINSSGTANVTFNGSSNADVLAKGTTNLTLLGSDYSDMHIKAFNGTTTTVTVKNSASDVTIEQMINDPDGRTSDGIMNVIIDTAGHKAIVEQWATVNSITLKNGSSIKLNNHRVDTLTMESGSGTVTSGADISGNQHGITNLVIGDNAALTLGNVATVTTVTGASGTLTVSKNLTVNNASAIGTLSVSGDSTIKLLKNLNVDTLNVTGGSNFMFSDEGIGSDANHRMGDVSVADDASLTFGTANTTVGAITLGTGSTITVGDGSYHKYDLTTTGLTVNGNANINADLVVNGGMLTFADNTILTMGCDVTIGNDVTVVLTDAMVESIMNGNDVEIIAGVDKAYLSQSLTFIGSGSMSSYVDEHEGVYALKQVGDKIYITPEPATATLSLLALAALAARRKRR